MQVLRTPDERFESLPGYEFEPHYCELLDGEGGRLRLHYVDEGPRDAAVVLMLHGEPSWSYLYREMIPLFTVAGHRAVAPDLIGFGRSDKPSEIRDYSYQRHVDWIREWLLSLDLRHITLIGQDWGGLIGLRLAAEQSDRFDRIVVANAGLPTGEGQASEAFLNWRRFSQQVPVFAAGQIVQFATLTELPPAVVAAYDAPFPDESYKAGARIFPSLVPISTDDPASEPNRKAWSVLERWEKPFLTAFSDGDPITAGGELIFQARVPGARGRSHATIAGAGHFLQEDRGAELARVVNAFIAETPS
jgi:haloalkane dehalogenase